MRRGYYELHSIHRHHPHSGPRDFRATEPLGPTWPCPGVKCRVDCSPPGQIIRTYRRRWHLILAVVVAVAIAVAVAVAVASLWQMVQSRYSAPRINLVIATRDVAHFPATCEWPRVPRQWRSRTIPVSPPTTKKYQCNPSHCQYPTDGDGVVVVVVG